MNTIESLKNVPVNDWTAEREIIASNVFFINIEMYCGPGNKMSVNYIGKRVPYPVRRAIKDCADKDLALVTAKEFIHACCVNFHLEKRRLEVLTVCTLFSCSVGRVLQAKMISHMQTMRMMHTITIATTIPTSPLAL